MIKLTSKINLEGCTLFVPSVAVGNVGQLAVDLVIFNLDMQRIGRIIHHGFIPVVGLNPYSEDSTDHCTAIDLYANVDKKVVAVQIRSPLINKSTEFFNDLELFIKEHKLIKVIILTSSYAYEKRDNLSRTTGLQFIASPAIIAQHKKAFEDLQWVQYEPKSEPYTRIEEDKLRIPGGGYASSLFNVFSGAGISSVILFKFCSEGDNTPDAIELTDSLNRWMHLIDTDSNGRLNLKYPPSWKYLFGNPPSSEMY